MVLGASCRVVGCTACSGSGRIGGRITGPGPKRDSDCGCVTKENMLGIGAPRGCAPIEVPETMVVMGDAMG